MLRFVSGSVVTVSAIGGAPASAELCRAETSHNAGATPGVITLRLAEHPGVARRPEHAMVSDYSARRLPPPLSRAWSVHGHRLAVMKRQALRWSRGWW